MSDPQDIPHWPWAAAGTHLPCSGFRASDLLQKVRLPVDDVLDPEGPFMLDEYGNTLTNLTGHPIPAPSDEPPELDPQPLSRRFCYQCSCPEDSDAPAEYCRDLICEQHYRHWAYVEGFESYTRRAWGDR